MRGKAIAWLPFTLALIAVSVAVSPEGERIIIRITSYSAILVTGGLAFPRKINLAAIALVLAPSVMFSGGMLVWNGGSTGTADLGNRIGAVAMLSLVAYLVSYCAFNAAEIELRQQEKSQLEGTIGQLTSANVGFQEYARYVDERSREIERKRITREIHDVIGFTLTTVMMLIRECILNIAKKTPTSEVVSLLETADRQVQEGLEETRKSLHLLRSIDASSIPLTEGVRKLAASFQTATGVEVGIDCGNVVGMTAIGNTATVISMLQEGMTNALRHGKASQLRISLWVDNGTLVVDVLDNGKGGAVHAEGIGLAGMRERIVADGGTLRAGPASDGFRLTARLPINRPTRP